MRKQTLWLLIILVGAISVVTIGARSIHSPFQKMLAQVGVVIGVAPNPYNTLNDQLDQKQADIDQQESELAAEQAAFASSTAAASAVPPMVWYLSFAVALLALLVIINFYLDWRRARKEKREQRSNVISMASDDIEPPKN